VRQLIPIMDKIIYVNQSSFTKGGQLMDEVVAINEIFYLAQKGLKECLIYKVDFEKGT